MLYPTELRAHSLSLPVRLRLRQGCFGLATLLLMAVGQPATALEVSAGGTLVLDGGPMILVDVVVPQPATASESTEWRVAAIRGYDRWQRPLAIVISTAGVSLAAELVQAGKALVSPNAASGELAALRPLEQSARTARRGLWAHRRWRLQDAADVRGATGDLVLVEGQVLQAAWAGDWLYLNFGADRQQDFTARIDRGAVRGLARGGVEAPSLVH